MSRSILPFILASLGLIIILLARNMPLFEWEISDVFSSTYEVDIQSNSWKVKLGEPLERYSKDIVVSKDNKDCRHASVNFDITRSRIDKELERISLNIDNITRSWARVGYPIGFVIFVAYIWIFTLLYKRPFIEAFIYTIVVGFLYFQMTQIVRVLAPRIVPVYFGTIECYKGIVLITAKLSTIHFEMILVYLIGILLELGAFGEMFSQITRAVASKKKVLTSE